jgi:plasmid stabilization system protein ParE
LKVTFTEEAVADIVEAITYLNDRNPTAAAILDAQIAQCIDRLAAQEFDGCLASAIRRACAKLGLPPFRIYYQRHYAELLIVRVYHQTRRPLAR